MRRWLPPVAAAVATVGDLLMLSVVAGGGQGLLWVGGVLGVAAIPLYALGYRQAAGLAAATSPPAGRLVARTGLGAAMVGAAIHGLTARHIAIAGPSADPLASVAESTTLLVLWAAAALLVVVASAAFAVGVRRAPWRRLAWSNPALLTVAIAAGGATTAWGRAFLAPAAPNLAHVAFFAACAARLGARAGFPIR